MLFRPRALGSVFNRFWHELRESLSDARRRYADRPLTRR